MKKVRFAIIILLVCFILSGCNNTNKSSIYNSEDTKMHVANGEFDITLYNSGQYFKHCRKLG